MKGYSPEKMGQRLRQARNQLGFGLRAFCREYNLSPSVWCRLERGLQTQHVTSMVTLCEQFNIAPTWLLFGVGPQTIAQDAAARLVAQVQEKKEDFWGWKQKSETIVDRIRLTDVSY